MSTTHMNQESGWAVGMETVGNTTVLGHPPPHMALRIKTDGLFVEERFSRYTQKERQLVASLKNTTSSCCIIS